MSEFSPDPLFVQRAVIAIRELERLVVETPRANHRLVQISEDVEAVLKRFLRGAHCRVCDEKAVLPAIQYAVFCSADCRHLYKKRGSQTEELIREAISEHSDSEAQS
jgi:hypothetical protein